jgi:putative spermidine/putrescine transport system substrate-binding protein
MFNKRRLFALMLSVTLIPVSGCARSDSKAPVNTTSEVQLRLASFGGSFQAALDSVVVQPIADRLGVKASLETYGGDYDHLAATIQNGTNPYDLVHVETRFMFQAGERGLAAPIDWQVVPKDSFVAGATNPHAVGLLSWALVLAWNADRLPPGTPPPSSWADFFDLRKYPGPRALRNTPEGNLEIALLADGVSPTAVSSGGLDVQRALRKLGAIRGSITWWSSGAELEQKLTSSAVMAAAWNGRAAYLKHSVGLPVGWTYNHAINQFDWWIIPANSKHKDLAMRFLAETAKGTGQVAIAREFGYGPVARAAVVAMPANLRAETSSAPENASRGLPFQGNWWAQNSATVSNAWNGWRLRSGN